MANFTGIECPVCKEKFQMADDVVVCPICGTPHHRECYQKIGRCAFEENHGDGYQWERPYAADQGSASQAGAEESGETVPCPQCGTVNPKDALFCVKCGYNLHAQEQQQNAANYAGMYQAVSPLGGVHPDADIDGVPAAEVAAYVRENSHFYLPRFKALADKTRSVCWSWSACLFHFVYFFYRKMYLLGALLMAVYCACLAPSFIIAGQYVQYMYTAAADATTLFSLDPTSSLSIWFNVSRIVAFGLSILLGMFGTRIYKFCAIRRIKKVKELAKKSGHADVKGLLSQVGGVSRVILVIVLGLFFLSYMGTSFFMALNMFG
ncbi:RING finger protein [Zongyangia hominis]|uniref:DUF2628 domain-containing protein n=1 Tax=Zongyangia hominis TaxID=2763677 RepID=A0A926IB47_9FIRM|nr:RING finger protein [Zongyangia hominis]MBC8569745.1 DUF2628 domain-containing protein [Zongyangia hominis]